MSAPFHTPGSLVSARGREWVVLTGSSADTLQVRPVTGTDEDRTLIHLPLEAEPVREARFPLPSAQQVGGHDSALLLRDALLLSLRRGAGPFRSFGQISVEPRAYQLVPLLMALKLDPVRLLIADDVGVGKTIEALLIARELLDRGDIERTVVLCPPHLVDQWVTELEVRFHLRAAAGHRPEHAGAWSGAFRPGASIFSEFTTAHRRQPRLREDPRAARPLPAGVPGLRHRRRSAHLRRRRPRAGTSGANCCRVWPAARRDTSCCSRRRRTAGTTPAFYRLLGLLDPDFESLAEATGTARERLRTRLARHFVQRRRPDIAEWHDGDIFPRRETAEELTYQAHRSLGRVLRRCP